MSQPSPRILEAYQYTKTTLLFILFFSLLSTAILIFEVFLRFNWLSLIVLQISLLISIGLLRHLALLNWNMQVFSDRIRLFKGDATKNINFSDIAKVEFLQSIVSGRINAFRFYLEDGKKVLLVNMWRRPDYLIESLWQARKDLFSEQEYKQRLEQLIQFDHVFSYIADSKWDRVLVGVFPLLFFISSAIYSVYTGSHSLLTSALALYLICLMLFQSVAAVAAYMIRKQFRLEFSENKHRDLELEKKLKSYFIFAYSTVFLLISVLQFSLVQIEHEVFLAKRSLQKSYQVEHASKNADNFEESEKAKEEEVY